jgi:hypothetical protein
MQFGFTGCPGVQVHGKSGFPKSVSENRPPGIFLCAMQR